MRRFEHFKKENSNTDLIVSQGWSGDYDSEIPRAVKGKEQEAGESADGAGSSCVFVKQGDKSTE